MKQYSAYTLGDMTLSYHVDDEGHVGMRLIPGDMQADVAEKDCAVESLVQLHVRGDCLPSAYGNGATMAGSASTQRMKLEGQRREGDAIVTILSDGAGRLARHRVTWREGLRAVRVSVAFENRTGAPLTLEMIASLNLGGLTPFDAGDAHGALRLHRARSAWSDEGRMVCESIERLHLEPSWARHGWRVEKFGQVGSMPVRGWFPFAAVEDTAAGAVWAMQLACPSSWQMELRRRDTGLAMTAGLADEDYGHWSKTLAPGERFETPEAYLTVARGGVESTAQRLLDLHRENWVRRDEPLPLLFNEYCATWGVPSHANLSRVVRALRGRGFDYLVIDCGWYGRDGVPWYDCGGDWIPNEKELFPEGLRATVDMIRDAGMKPGIWFEPETCCRYAEIGRRESMLLRRNGAIIDTDNRRFLDMRRADTREYLDRRVLGLLHEYGFDYVKLDYNDCIGVGCDGADSLGEGLRQNMQGTLGFFRRLREAMPGLCIECCASGGHRLEPSFLAVSDMASFSDAHECPEIPIIAARLHRLMLAGQSQIWAVIRASDSLRRINYSLVSAMLGVMCLSGDVADLDDGQWRKIDEGIAFYRAARDVIRDGESALYGEVSESWRHPRGWQAVCRAVPRGGALVTVHAFGGDYPSRVEIPVRASHIARVMCSEDNRVRLEGGRLSVELKAPFEAVAVLLDGPRE